MIALVLSLLFPPRLPGPVRDWAERVDSDFVEQGWAGNVKRRYRDGRDRYFTENRLTNSWYFSTIGPCHDPDRIISPPEQTHMVGQVA